MVSINTRTVSIIAWALILISVHSFVSAVDGAMQDIDTLFGEDASSHPVAIIPMIFVVLISVLPLVFSVGLLKRKNWGRIGVIVYCIINIGMGIVYIFSTGLYHPLQMLWAAFFFIVIMTLRNDQYKDEFFKTESVTVINACDSFSDS